MYESLLKLSVFSLAVNVVNLGYSLPRALIGALSVWGREKKGVAQR